MERGTSATSARPEELRQLLHRLFVRANPQLREITELTRLSAGATNETWAFDAVGSEHTQRLILRRSAGVRNPELVTLATEAAILAAMRNAAVPVPRVVHVLVPEDGIGDGFVMERVEGETIPSKILRTPELAPTRSHLAAQLGTIAAAIHAVSPRSIARVAAADAERQLAHLRRQYEGQGTARPVSSSHFVGCASICPNPSRRSLFMVIVDTAI